MSYSQLAIHLVILITSFLVILSGRQPTLTTVTSTPFDIADFGGDFDGMDFGLGGEEVGGGDHEEGLEVPGVTGSLAEHGTITAVALLKGPKTQGVVRFTQIGAGPTSISGFVRGLFPLGRHGFHVHEHRVVGLDCESAGEHYNPTMETHGAPDSPSSHVGDLGNLQADKIGNAKFEVNSLRISLRGKYSVIERSLVVHLRTDDLGTGWNRESKKSGNSGERIACGTIKFIAIK